MQSKTDLKKNLCQDSRFHGVSHTQSKGIRYFYSFQKEVSGPFGLGKSDESIAGILSEQVVQVL